MEWQSLADNMFRTYIIYFVERCTVLYLHIHIHKDYRIGEKIMQKIYILNNKRNPAQVRKLTN